MEYDGGPFAPLYPSLQFVLVVLFLSSYCIFLTFIGAQLCLTWYMRNKLLSYHTIFLMLGLVWTVLRVFLFALLLHTEVTYALLDWCLRCGPVVLNFVMLTLFTLCFIQVLIECSRSISAANAGYYQISYTTKKVAYGAYALMLLIFLTINITSFILQMVHKSRLYAVIQLSLQEGCMILSCVVLSVTLYFVQRGGPVVQGLIEREGKSLPQVLWSGSMLVVMYVSHSAYCIYCVSTDDYNDEREVYVNDMVLNDTLSKRSLAPISIALIIWDFVPVIVMLHFFKTKARPSDLTTGGLNYSDNTAQNFFDNPQRYEDYSDDSNLLSDHVLTEPSCSPSVVGSTNYGSLETMSAYNSPVGTATERQHYMSPIERSLQAYSYS